MTQRLTKIDEFFKYVGNYINAVSINPTNVAEVKKAFFRRKHNPHFSYRSYPEELDALKSVLEVMQFKKSAIEKIYAEKRDFLVKEIELKKAIGSKNVTKKAIAMYPKPSAKLIQIAKQLLTLPISPKDERILRKDALKILKKAVIQLNIEWKVTSRKLVTSANVDTARKRIEMNKGERFGKNYIQRLAIHEIGTHVLRAENGALQPYDIFRSGLGGYLQTEEGLAAYNEFEHGFMTNTSLRNYAGRVLAIHFALEHDFKTTFTQLRKYFDKNIAFKLTVRAKRGLSDTSYKGGYTKDCVYLRGFLEVLTFAKKHSVSELYVGKVGIKHLPLLKSVKGLCKPEFLPHSLLKKHIIHPGKLQVEKAKVKKLLTYKAPKH